jgi:hypothetical protein
VEEVTQCWGELGEPDGRVHEAVLLMTVVYTSVRNERAFSAMTYVEKWLRSSLVKHLGACVTVGEQTLFDLTTFPHTHVLATWREASVCGKYLS